MKLQSKKRKGRRRKLVKNPSIRENSEPPTLDHHELQSCVEKELEKFSSRFLPEEIIFNILRFLPANTLHNLIRYVCSQWNSIIKNLQFITTHHLYQNNYASSLILIPRDNIPDHWCDVGGNNVDDFVIKSTRRERVQSDCYCLSSCNGLILMYGPLENHAAKNTEQYRYYLLNPNRGRKMLVPEHPFVSRRSTPCYIGFVPSSNVYKLVMLDRRGRIYILTVNVDQDWRRINTNTIVLGCVNDAIGGSGGFLYWKCYLRDLFARFDFENEILSYVSLPKIRPSKLSSGYLVPWGNSLSFCQIKRDYTMDVWKMKDEKTQEWVKYPSIKINLDKGIYGDLHKLIKSSSQLCPLCWLNTNMILFQFNYGAGFFLYDVKTGLSFSYLANFKIKKIIPHVNSLASV